MVNIWLIYGKGYTNEQFALENHRFPLGISREYFHGDTINEDIYDGSLI